MIINLFLKKNENSLGLIQGKAMEPRHYTHKPRAEPKVTGCNALHTGRNACCAFQKRKCIILAARQLLLCAIKP